jgi:hypothetical protein
MPVPKIPLNAASEVRHGEGIADPRYLLREIEELKGIAARGGHGTLAYLLDLAAIEARLQVQNADESSGRNSDVCGRLVQGRGHDLLGFCIANSFEGRVVGSF